MQGPKKRVLVTGAAGYIASQFLPTFQGRYDVVLIDVTNGDRSIDDLEIGPYTSRPQRLHPIL